MRTIVVTNDFPPRQGGIQSYVYELIRRLPHDDVVVYASDHPGAQRFDAAQGFEVIRHPTRLLVPTPAARRRIVAAARRHRAESVWFGASAPLGLLAPALRHRGGAHRVVASSHGHETGWAATPGARQVLRRIGDGCDVVTYITEYTRTRLGGTFGPHPLLRQLTPGVDIERFRPGVDGDGVRARYRVTGRPVIVCVSRLVPRKGQDLLIDALPAVRRVVPGVALLLVGSGPYESKLRARAERRGVRDDVVFTGGVDLADLPEYYAAGDVFAMPCRTRRLGLDVEGFGMVYLEASAVGRPVIAGTSGGAPEAVRDGETGFVVDGRDVQALTDRLVQLLGDDALRASMGAAGIAWAHRFRWELLAQRLRSYLTGDGNER